MNNKKQPMDKLTRNDGASPDMVEENIERLRELFPEVFADGSIDFEALKETLGEYVDDREERYSFTWHGKARARQISQQPSTATLRPCPEESVNWDTTKNIFIEGDNLEVLKLLQKSYHGKVKMIYIDPPYNTGNEFIYPDNFKDTLDSYLRYTGQVDGDGAKLSANAEAGGRYHTNWLNMMYPRLKLARNLLTDDGAIFVSIDDHEVQNLRHLSDEIFGAENFVATIVWEKVFASKASSQYFSENHDYIVVYAKQRSEWTRNLIPRTPEQEAAYTNPDSDPRGPWRSVSLSARNAYAAGKWSTVSPAGRFIEGPPPGRYWAVSKESFDTLCSDNRITWGADGRGVPRRKLFLSEVQNGIVPTTIWNHKQVGSTQDSKKELLARVSFGKPEDVFDTPKPTALVRQMLRVAADPASDDVILDFFGGSGTTGDAVMAHNAEEGTAFRFIVVQLPEPTGSADYATIAEITKTRLRAAGEARRNASEDDLPGLAHADALDTGFRVLKLDRSNIKPWDGDFDTMEQDLLSVVENIRPDRSEQDVLYELLLKYGLDLAARTEERAISGSKVTIVGAGALIVCLAPKITLEVVSGIADLKSEFDPSVMRVVFKDSGFESDVVKTNANFILREAGITDVKSL